MSGGAYYEVDQKAVMLHDGARTDVIAALPESFGSPLFSARDVAGEWVAIAFEHGLGILRLLDGELRFRALDHGARPTALSVRNDVAGLIAGTEIAFLDLGSCQWNWREDLSGWKSKYDIDRTLYALPLSDQRFVLVSFRERGLLHDSQSFVQRIDRARGSWQAINDQTVTGLSQLQACTSDGRAIFLAGVHDHVERAPGPGQDAGRFYQTLLVFRINLEDFAVEEVVRRDRHETVTEVQSLAANGNRLAVVLEGGVLHVFRLDGNLAQEPYVRNFGVPVEAVWLSDNDLLVLGDGIRESVTIP